MLPRARAEGGPRHGAGGALLIAADDKKTPAAPVVYARAIPVYSQYLLYLTGSDWLHRPAGVWQVREPRHCSEPRDWLSYCVT